MKISGKTKDFFVFDAFLFYFWKQKTGEGEEMLGPEINGWLGKTISDTHGGQSCDGPTTRLRGPGFELSF